MAKQQKTNIVGTESAPVIWDNQERTAADFLRPRLAPGVLLRAASAYFSIYGYNALKPGIDEIGKMRFLFGDPKSAASPDPAVGKTPSYELTEIGLKPTEILQQKALATECAKWIEEKAEVRTMRKAGLMHGKMFHISGDDKCAGRTEYTSALAGSSNFTARGLGATENSNLELNLAIESAAGQNELAAWFDRIWDNEELTEDAKKDVLDALASLAKDYSPEFLYYKTLFELFYDRTREREEAGKRLKDLHFYETEVWKKLYKFQQDGVHGAIHRLTKHNGCIIADSVGLGKTFEALAVIKFFELRGEDCLVLCPKRLGENWKRYSARYDRANNPLAADKLNYRVLSHTDLSRDSGQADGINLANFDWSKFGLIIIDESHNFRNTGNNRYDEEGNTIGKSRYNLLMDNVIKAGVKTRVLMLSATPVNTDLNDLRNQIELMTEGQDGNFAELGIPSLRSFFSQAQGNFKAWEEERKQKTANGRENKEALLEKLGGEFLMLLDAVSIARSRRHIEAHYPEVTADLGGFPRRAKPENRAPATDSKGKLSYDDMYDRISEFGLYIYNPSAYFKEGNLAKEKKTSPHDPFGQMVRERLLIHMLRINFLKRLESSAESFRLTLERTLGRIDTVLEKIERMADNAKIENAPDDEEYEEDEDFIVGKRVQYRLSELNTEGWARDLRRDRKLLQEIYDTAKEVDESRDAKLHELTEILSQRIQTPTADKEGKQCRKALIFTAFSDTAKYLYQNLTAFADKHSVKIALVTGGGGNNKTNAECGNEFGAILDNFSPRARNVRVVTDSEIDFLIATDCIAEGQNLQDCDLVINYDIHWNPTRLIQRFGRIDRIGSLAEAVRTINFWPTDDFERYLHLKSRVEARMALTDATATGQDNIFDDAEKAAQMELDFRDNQLRRMRKDAALWDGGAEDDERLEMSDFTLDDFIAELIAYLEKNKDELMAAQPGIYALTAADRARHEKAATGVIFCLRHTAAASADKAQKMSPLHPRYLVYVGADGRVLYSFGRAKQILGIMGALCRGEKEPLAALGSDFNAETDNGRNMEAYNALVKTAIDSICKGFSKVVDGHLGRRRGFTLPEKSEQPIAVGDFELVTWLVIK